jgi:hypothetical protein
MYDRLKQKGPKTVFADTEIQAFNVNGTDNNGKKSVIFTILVNVTRVLPQWVNTVLR